MPTDDKDRKAVPDEGKTEPSRSAADKAKEDKAAEDQASREQSGVFGNEGDEGTGGESASGVVNVRSGSQDTPSDTRHESNKAEEHSPAYKAIEADVRKAISSGDHEKIEAQRTALADMAGHNAPRTEPQGDAAVVHPEGDITTAEFREFDAMLRDALTPPGEDLEGNKLQRTKRQHADDAKTSPRGDTGSTEPTTPSSMGGGPTRHEGR